MPLYEFQCTKCHKRKEIKMTLAEHAEHKQVLTPAGQKTVCECGYLMTQCVSRLNFVLEGQGWFGKSDTCVDPYGITEQEMRKNLDLEKRIEDDANNMNAKDRSTQED